MKGQYFAGMIGVPAHHLFHHSLEYPHQHPNITLSIAVIPAEMDQDNIVPEFTLVPV